MANWCLVENNEIKELHDQLPKSWKHISGLNLASNDLDFLKTLGWLPVVKQYQEYDRQVEQVDGFNHQVQLDVVVETLKLIPVPPQPIPEPEPVLSFEEQKLRFMNLLREQRNQKLKDCDWTQLADTQLLFSEETKQQWVVYRQALRDLPGLYETNEIVDIAQVIWPEV